MLDGVIETQVTLLQRDGEKLHQIRAKVVEQRNVAADWTRGLGQESRILSLDIKFRDHLALNSGMAMDVDEARAI